MDRSQLSRRKFLSSAGRSTAATGAIALLLKTSDLFSQQLETTTPTARDRIDVQKLRSQYSLCLLYTSPSPRDQRGSRMPSSA